MILSHGSANSREIELNGAGATFPLPFYMKALNIYSNQKKIKINYKGVGSGDGLRSLLSKEIDFAGTDFIRVDGFPKDIDSLIYIPTCIGAVVVTYNLSGNPSVRFTPEILVDIFLGKINKWNDPKLMQINKDIKLPEQPITVVRRSDGSGTTYVFTEFLSRHNKEWQNRIGIKNRLVGLPGIEVRGNPGVAGVVKQKSGSIGYVELVYALANNLPTGYIMNDAGEFIKPSVESIRHAANSYKYDDRYSTLIEASVKEAYPISCFTFMAVFKEQNYAGRDLSIARELVMMLEWLIYDGQQYAMTLHYVSLPANIQKLARTSLEQIRYNGMPLLLKKDMR